VKIGLENEHFPGIDELRESQLLQRGSFSRGKASWRSVHEPHYRKLEVYTKSTGQYKKERARRRQARVLAAQGFTQAQIAKKLGVHIRTVKRDWIKIRPYVRSRFKKAISQIREQERKEYQQRFEGLTSNQKLGLLGRDLKGIKEASEKIKMLQQASLKEQERQRRQLIVTLNFDEQTEDGFPRVVVFPAAPHLQLSGKFDVKLLGLKNGEKRELCGLHFSFTQ
jgi:transposase